MPAIFYLPSVWRRRSPLPYLHTTAGKNRLSNSSSGLICTTSSSAIFCSIANTTGKISATDSFQDASTPNTSAPK
ncbi:unnamed protein product [Meloidogyne enterolobii]|uniref:Uncharacterized protein n=1 Tax=Meloidogyne enterolobii TaxID=390850 RepID=A0ACB0ZJI0_MELEN